MKDRYLIDAGHPVVSNHQVYSRHLLPGFAYIDLIYQFFRDHGLDFRLLKLTGLKIFNPLIVGKEAPVMLDIRCGEPMDGQWQITVEGRLQQNGSLSADPVKYITAKMLLVPEPEFGETLDVQGFMNRSHDKIDLDSVYAQCRDQGLVHTGFLKAVGALHKSKAASLIDLRIPPGIGADGILFHPTLLDGSGIGSKALFSEITDNDARLFLPLYFGSFQARSALTEHCLTRISSKSIKRKNDLLFLDMAFFSPSGEKLAELTDIAYKQVRDPGDSISGVRQESAPAGVDPLPPASSWTPDKNTDRADTAEQFLREIFSDHLGVPIALIAPEIGYYEMGVNSAQLLEIVNSIEKSINQTLSPTLLFEYPKIRDLAQFLEGTYPDIIWGSDKSNLRAEYTGPVPDAAGRRSPRLPGTVEDEDMAIIGMAGRFPGANNIREFWDNLKGGKNSIEEIPSSRWNPDQFSHLTSPSGKPVSRWGGFIDEPYCFDAQFFRVSPREAENMDPQERLFLQTCWEAIEDAGYTPRTLSGSGEEEERRSVGVFAGVMHKDYTLLGANAASEGNSVQLTLNNAGIANRVSYFCDFHGPSLAVDTACSSSLIAVHLAIESLIRKECTAALAGGVNLSLHFHKYVTYGMMDFHSSSGHCQAFGKGGDGYVSGEGVGAVLLKPLSKAVQDRDRIYAVVKASAVNHGGTASGITVPNPRAQADVIAACLEKAKVPARSIGYVEAHGTGTSLGDPIEINGLAAAFGRYTRKRQYCAVGSVKSNIGHGESAAGVSALIKTVLQLHNKTLVPSLHNDELNPHIDFENSPFYVQKTLENWPAGDGRRRAGVSSFGATGANAHLILEEYPADASLADDRDLFIIPLSAKTGENLNTYARELLGYLKNLFQENSRPPAGFMSSMAYTLQTGRKPMRERVVFLAHGVSDLMDKLGLFSAQGKVPADTWKGRKELQSDAGDLDRESIRQWAAAGMSQKIAQAWARGADINWSVLYPDLRPLKISLPTYPFSREIYALPKTGTASRNSDFVHPLLHRNTSTLRQQRFTTRFTGKEPFFTDHIVAGQKILPGVAYLEMARTAVETSIRDMGEAIRGIRLKNIAWPSPIIAGNGPVPVHIGLTPEDDGTIAFEIHTQPDGKTDVPLIHSQGKAQLLSDERPDPLSIHEVKSACNLAEIQSDRVYEIFRAMGLAYGPSHRGIDRLYIGRDQALARLRLPSVHEDVRRGLVFHPGMADAALQAVLGLVLNPDLNQEPGKGQVPALPFALDGLEIFDPAADNMWAVVRKKETGAGQIFDIDLCHQDGSVSAAIRGFSLRSHAGSSEDDIQASSEHQPDEFPGNVMLMPVWDSVIPENGSHVAVADESVLVLGGNPDRIRSVQSSYKTAIPLDIQPTDTIEQITRKLEQLERISHIWWIAPDAPESIDDADALIDSQRQGVLTGFKLMKSLIGLGYESTPLNWTVITDQAQCICPGEAVNPTHAAIHGLAGSAAKELTHWKFRIIDLAGGKALPLGQIIALPPDRQGRIWGFRNQRWFRQKLMPFQAEKTQTSPYRKEGVYVVIGGAGTVGAAWTRYMLDKYQAKVVWIGRRPLDERLKEQLADLGPRVRYIRADAANLADLERARDRIIKAHAEINGVVHAAMVLTEERIKDLSEEGFLTAFSSKVDVSIRMTQVFSREPLDFILFFSSVISFIKNPGQSHYASGCAFKDAFALRLSTQLPFPVRIMNWGYWNSDTIAGTETEQRLSQIGIGLIEPPEAMDKLSVLMSAPTSQIGLMKITKPLTVEGMDRREQLSLVRETSLVDLADLFRIIPEKKWREQLEPLTNVRENGEMNRILFRLLSGYLQSLNLFPEKGLTFEQIKENGTINPFYHPWLAQSHRFLEGDNHPSRAGDTKSKKGTPAIDLDAEWTQWREQFEKWRTDPLWKAQARLLEATLKALPEILTGRVRATDIIFPGSSMELVEGIYRDNPISDYYNTVMADTVYTYLKKRNERNPDAGIRILEIGAGTGGTSSLIFSRVKSYHRQIEEYCYTDISKAFLLYAEKHYGPNNPFLTYQRFDVENPVAGQGLETGKYDIVLATNVLHATRDITRTVCNAKALLKKSGLLLLNEMSTEALLTHLTFGLLDGWWRYEDPQYRIPGCPGLLPETWEHLLLNQGFSHVYFPVKASHRMGQQIILAASDGVIRQKRPSPQVPKETASSSTVGAENQPGKLEARRKADDDEIIKGKTIAYLKTLVGETLKMPVRKIDPLESLENYGIDSILIVQMTNALNKVFEDVSSTLFFELNTVESLAEHFLSTQKPALLSLFDKSRPAVADAGSPRESGKQEDEPQSFLPLSTAGRFLSQPMPAALNSTTPGVFDVAVIGLSGRYPKASNVRQFWEHLKNGVDCIAEIPKDRWNWRDFEPGKTGDRESIYTKWGGFLDEIDTFDPLFFHISPAEAEKMDPQERLFLEEAYASIEDAGYTPETLCHSRKIGVYVGVMSSTYSMQSNYWSIANRVSYLMNFQGPSMALDTACSSSLTAVHLALEGLYNGTCDLALAGGVKLTVNPVHYMNLAQMNMLSPGNRCCAFGAGADGFVDGEGVGVVVLKPLKKAVDDGDAIYGIIKGSMINTCGKTNGYTVPSPAAQLEVVEKALGRAGVDARTVSYLEAHGTGTALGDPIEISALTRAFEKQTRDRQFCAIGSVKSNIGHCESAAGVAGLTKVLLQLKHRKLVPSLHVSVLNPKIDFDKSPFKVQQELAHWPQPKIELAGRMKTYPRVAGISSFGAGGANAHIIVEEYNSQGRNQELGRGPGIDSHLIVLSAKTEERLVRQAEQLLGAIDIQSLTDTDLTDIGYTLQVGRVAMEERLAVIVRSMDELKSTLSDFVEKGPDAPGIHYGKAFVHEKVLGLFANDADMETVIDHWINKRKYTKIAELWTKGLNLDWERIAPASSPKRIHLPTYPFAKEKYWSPESCDRSSTGSGTIETLHPLLHRNTSNLFQQRYTSIFSGKEFYIEGHRADGQQILPGSAQIEMACAAVLHAWGPDASPPFTISGVQFLQPVPVADSGVTLHLGMEASETDGVEFKIYAGDLSSETDDLIPFTWGKARLDINEAVPPPDLEKIRQRCKQSRLTPEYCYARLEKLGLTFGDRMKNLGTVHVGDNEALADISIPESLPSADDRFLLHPCLTDSALQASVALNRDAETITSAIPTGIDTIQILKPGSSQMRVWVRNSGREDAPMGQTAFDMVFFDETGAVSANIKGFTIQQIHREVEMPPSAPDGDPPEQAADIPKHVPLGDLSISPADMEKRAMELKGLSLEQAVNWDLKEHIGKLLKIPKNRLDNNTNFARFGFDSIRLGALAAILSMFYEIKLTPAVIFNHATLTKLGAHLISQHPEKMTTFYGSDEPAKSRAPSLPNPAPASLSRLVAKKSQFPGRIRDARTEPIAIIGMSARLPGCRNLDEFWELLARGNTAVTEIPLEKLDWRPHYSASKSAPDKIHCKWCGSVPGEKEFDAAFFDFTDEEAECMDPRQRLLLQESWNALEDAGYGESHFASRDIGMFVGADQGDYQLIVKDQGNVASNHNGVLASRLAYFLDFNGPVMSINTACSSGLVAAHQACMSLRNQECRTAIAAGVNLILTTTALVAIARDGMLSRDGKCYSFDKRANGTVPAEAVAVVVLKRMSDAIQDGDPIYAVIKGSGINYDGKTNNIESPSQTAQTRLYQSVYDQYGIQPERIEHVVAHGSATSLGDPIEVNALHTAFSEYTRRRNFCALTSVKPNIGHTYAASGLVNLMALVQSMRHNTIPPSLNFEKPNELIDWETSPFYVNTTKKTWPETEGPLKTGALSSFGMSGTNAHVVVESYANHQEDSNPVAPFHLLVLSALSPGALAVKTAEMIQFLDGKSDRDLHQIAFTLLQGRKHFKYRCAVVVQDCQDAVLTLKKLELNESSPKIFSGTVPDDFIGQNVLQDYINALICPENILTVDTGKSIETLHALADLYCQGYRLDWQRLYGDRMVQRVHLPVYPFEKKSYWVSEKPAAKDEAGLQTTVKLQKPRPLNRISARLEKHLADFFSGEKAAGSPDFNLSNPIFEHIQGYGPESSIGNRLMNSLESEFKIKPTCRDLFEASTFSRLIEVISPRIEGEVK